MNAQETHWETIVSAGTTWKYIVPNTQPSDSWKNQSFDTSSWLEGPSGIGYGDDDDATQIPQSISVYMRKEFQVLDTSKIKRILLDIDYDDGFAAYLNGVEIGRNLLSGNPINFNDLAEGHHEAMLYQGNSPERLFFVKSLLQNGTNTLAVQVHNQSADSSDMSALPVLSVEVFGNEQIYNDTPVWFQEPTPESIEINFTSSNLPILMLDTSGEEIPSEPKIPASIKIIKRPNDQRNYVTDQNNSDYIDYEGPIQIEVRGSSSSLFSKKQYALTTYDDAGEKDNVKLLGMPKENDWILSGLAFDTTFVRDFVSYKLSNSIGQYASRAEYCELLLNGEYKGIYMLLEKLKADDSRIDIKKVDEDDNTLPKITGGYITKADKIEGEEVEAWQMQNYAGWETKYAHEHPKPDEVTTDQHDYIQAVFFDLDQKSLDANVSLSDGYPSIIDIPSFVDFILINELASNPDAYQFSTFFHKDRRGKLRAGPIWDLNLSFGNDLFFWGFDRSKYNVWQFMDGNVGSKFWQNLFNEPNFKCYLARRWNQLTATGQPLSENKIFELIDQTVSLITEAVDRQELQWNFDIDFTSRINTMKSFVTQRIAWLSTELSDTSLCDQITTPPLVISRIHYHPPQSDDGDYEFIEITNNSGNTVNTTGIYFGGLGLSYQFPPGSSIGPNQSVLLANNADVFLSFYGKTPFDEYSRKLSNNSQEIRLLDGFGNLIDSLTYRDEAPWPVEADGAGAHLVLNNLGADNSQALSWTKSFDYSNLSIIDSNENQLFVYPNPFTKYLYISLTNGQQIEKLNVYSLEGRLISSFNSSKNRDVFVMNNLSQGTYLVEVVSGSNSYIKQLIRK
ncbi:MAG: CotH kinase family protein [Flavobacteriaceae bacterium]